MSVVVGPDGNNLPDYTNDGVPSKFSLEVDSRIYTYAGREPFNPDYGLGLVDALQFPNPGIAGWRRRLQRSFQQLEALGYEYEMGDVRYAGGRLYLDVVIDGVGVRFVS